MAKLYAYMGAIYEATIAEAVAVEAAAAAEYIRTTQGTSLSSRGQADKTMSW